MRTANSRLLAIGIMAMGTAIVYAQDYPNKPLRILTSEPGGSSDLALRLIAQGISPLLGQQAIVDNRAGFICVETVARAQPDGYTLLFYGSITWLMPLLREHPTWDAVRDFAPITLGVLTPNIVVAHPSLPVSNIKELIALAKAKPAAINYGTAGIGGSTHLAAELFKAMAGVNLLHVPYKSSGSALNGLLGDEVQLMFATAGTVTPHIKSGKLKALAVTTAQPWVLAPGLPTVAASGVPGYESIQMLGMFAPTGTPAAVISRLNQETVRVLRGVDVKDKLLNAGLEAVGSSPGEFAAAIKADIGRLAKVIKDAGIRAD